MPQALIEVREPVERAILVGVPHSSLSPRIAREHLEELRGLAEAVGAQVVGSVSQRIDRPQPRYLLGEGKARELADLAQRREADLIIFDEELTPAQGKQLEDLSGVRVLDRSELILDIFATRARSKEARLQVELAQLQYMLPRLRRMWRHLSRIRGGIGLRGPGETQLETDRRLIGRRIASLRAGLAQVDRSRAVQRGSRRGEFRVALVGYTNAGKSSLLAALSGADVLVANRLFSTLDSATRIAEIAEGQHALVTDTVGFVRKLPHLLTSSFRSTLDEAREADVVLHVIDASRTGWRERCDVVNEVLAEMGVRQGRGRRLLVFNKVDRITHGEEAELRERITATEPTPAVFVSAYDPTTLDGLRSELLDRLRADTELVEVRLLASDGATLAAIYREGEVIDRRQDGDWVYVTGRLPVGALGRLRARGLGLARVDSEVDEPVHS